MEDNLTFDVLYAAYISCLKNKKRKIGTYSFVNDELCKNLMEILDNLNQRKYIPKQSNCYVVTDPALREIYAAQFGDRVVQHFYMNEIEEILENELVEGCCHGVPFLGKVSYPYGYQKPKKTTIIRVITKAKQVNKNNQENILERLNSQIGVIKRYNCRKLILNYVKIVSKKIPKSIIFDEKKLKFSNKIG